jgi:hypothetical protein
MKLTTTPEVAILKIKAATEQGDLPPSVSAHAQNALESGQLPFHHVTESVRLHIGEMQGGVVEIITN